MRCREAGLNDGGFYVSGQLINGKGHVKLGLVGVLWPSKGDSCESPQISPSPSSPMLCKSGSGLCKLHTDTINRTCICHPKRVQM